MKETQAISEARRYAAENFTKLGEREWNADRFAGGWLLRPQGEDLRWRTGVVCLMVMDDGQIHEDSSSRPPQTLMDKYASDVGEIGAEDG